MSLKVTPEADARARKSSTSDAGKRTGRGMSGSTTAGLGIGIRLFAGVKGAAAPLRDPWNKPKVYVYG